MLFCCGLLESPPVSSSVPLNSVGGPTHEYDMMGSVGRGLPGVGRMCCVCRQGGALEKLLCR